MNSYVCAHCGQIYDPGYAHVCHASRLIAEAKAARDKWWVAKLEDLFTDHPCDTICEENCKVCSYDLWQSLKQSLEVKQ